MTYDYLQFLNWHMMWLIVLNSRIEINSVHMILYFSVTGMFLMVSTEQQQKVCGTWPSQQN